MNELPSTAISPPEPQCREMSVGQLVYGGDGLARLPDGPVVFVPFTAPGDTVMGRIEDPKARPLRATVDQVITPSPHRAVPPCSVFRICGGCHWQHLDRETQRLWKQRIVAESLQRLGKLSGVEVQPTIGAESDWHYRNKVQWVVSEESDRVRLGYYQMKSHQPTPFDRCWIIPERVNALARTLEDLIPTGTGVEKIQVRISSEDKMLLSFSTEGTMARPPEALITQLSEAFPEMSGMTVSHPGGESCLWGEPFLMETMDDCTFQVSANSFFQVNPVVTRLMLQQIADCLPHEMDRFLDLYAGVGLFSFWLKDRYKEGVAVESDKSALLDFEKNLELNQCSNLSMRSGDVKKVLNGLEGCFQVALVDPPRAGCAPEVLTWLGRHVTEQLIYISCDPTTLARDLKRLTDDGWRIERVQPFDMFPQTYHIETMVSLKRT